MLSTLFSFLFRPARVSAPVAGPRPEAGDGLLAALMDELAEIAGDFRPVLIGDLESREQAERRLDTLPLVFAWRVPVKAGASRVAFDINPLPVRRLVAQVRIADTEAFRDLEGRLLAEIRLRADEALAIAPYR